MKEFAITERNLAAGLGVPHARLKELRRDRLEKDRDWALIGNMIRYTEEARALVLEALGLDDAKTRPSLACLSETVLQAGGRADVQGDGCEPVQGQKTARAWEELDPAAFDCRQQAYKDRICGGNVRRVKRYAWKPGDVLEAIVTFPRYKNVRIVGAAIEGAAIRIRVRNSRHFVKGMKAPVRCIDGDLFELTRPCPRWRGRW